MHGCASRLQLLLRGFAVTTILAAGMTSAAGDQDPASPAAAAAAAAEEVSRDLFGDPLPAGAVLRLGTTRLRHRRATSVAISPDGRVLASGSDESVRLWDPSTGLRIGELPHAAMSLAFSPDGKYLAIGGELDDVYLVSVAKRRVMFSGRHVGQNFSHRVNAVAFLPDGTAFVSLGGKGDLMLWDVATGQGAPVPEQGGEPSSFSNELAISPDGRFLASAFRTTIQLRRVKEGYNLAWIRESDGGKISSLVFSADGEKLFSAALRNGGSPNARMEIRTWDAETGELAGEMLHKMPIAWTLELALGPDRETITAAAGRNVLVLDAASLQVRQTFEVASHGLDAQAIAVADNGLLATCGTGDTAIGLWDLQTANPSLELANAHFADVRALAYTPDGRQIATGSLDGTVRLWDAKSGTQLRHFQYSDRRAELRSVVSSADGGLLAAAGGCYKPKSYDYVGSIKVWNRKTGELLYEYQVDESRFDRIAFSPDGRYLAALPDQTPILALRQQAPAGAAANARSLVAAARPIHLFRMNSRDRMRSILGHEQAVTAFDFTEDGTSLVSIAPHEAFCIWSLPDGRITRSIPTAEVSSAAISSDAEFAITTSADARAQLVTLQRWNLADDANPQPQDVGSYRSRDASVALEISGDGNLVAVGSNGGTVTLWDLRTRKEFARFTAPEARVYPLAFSPSGKQLVTGMDDGTAMVWNVPSARDDRNAHLTDPQRVD